MNRDEFLKKWAHPFFTRLTVKSDLDEVLKDNLINFKDFFNSEYEAPMPIRQDDIDNFINIKP